MADIELVIKIPNAVYRGIINAHRVSGGFWADNLFGTLCKCVSNGTPLPKGHGRLIDADKLKKEIYVIDVYSDESVKQQISDAPIIIEADKAESEET